ncbi:resolvase [Streptomyces solisilvae]|uniref:resolvase n=1 Tax=Streptomyces malaysiensis TaxID=92644 RepID=UPI003316CC80
MRCGPARRPAVPAAKTDTARTAYLEGRSIAALARDHGVSRGAIRTAAADLLPAHTAIEDDAPAPELPVTLDMPGKVADFLRSADLEPAERAALDQGVTVRRGQGYTLRVSTARAIHRQFLARCRPLDGGQGNPTVPAQRKARREYKIRVNALQAATAGP